MNNKEEEEEGDKNEEGEREERTRLRENKRIRMTDSNSSVLLGEEEGDGDQVELSI